MEKGIREFQRLFTMELDNIMRDATTRVSNSLVRLSPVDEGDYVAEWDAAINQWPRDTAQPPDPKKRTTRARLKDVISGVSYGESVFFENTDPVGGRLEYGYSQQAPQGVVRLTTRKWRGFVRGAGKAAQSRVKKKIVTTNV